MKKTYVHYGTDVYDPEITRRLVLSERAFERFDKPAGLWASPEDSDCCWKNWCEWEQFETERLKKSFRFVLRDGTRVLKLNSLKDAEGVLTRFPDDCPLPMKRLNLRKLYEEYDAVEAVIGGTDLRNETVFMGWDVDSICVWNPDAVKPLQ